MQRINVRRQLLPLLLVTSLTGCATSSPVVVQPPSPPPPSPYLLAPEKPSGSYSANVQRIFKEWQQKLTDSPTK
ncbi:MAG: hypothetical protein ABFD96_15870 [Armatimonadia bacterium]